MPKRVVAFTGPSNSGKTTTIVKVAQLLKSNYRLAIIKHDPSDKGVFDKEGKDSWKFTQTGAEVVVTSPTRTTFFSQRPQEIDSIVKLVGDVDLVIIEGLKTMPYPRIAIFRNTLDENYFPYSNALAIDNSIELDKHTIPQNLDILDLNNIEQLCEWIEKNAKIYEES
jgi:molybdopterin-guanine dinucleotide biosynthesis protein B